MTRLCRWIAIAALVAALAGCGTVSNSSSNSSSGVETLPTPTATIPVVFDQPDVTIDHVGTYTLHSEPIAAPDENLTSISSGLVYAEGTVRAGVPRVSFEDTPNGRVAVITFEILEFTGNPTVTVRVVVAHG